MSDSEAIKSKGLIYLIDDDLSFAVSLASALQLEGYSVIHYLGVMEFLNTEIDKDAIVISDMRMPKMTGLDLQLALKERRLTLPIIFVSGESTVNQAVSALKAGAIDFITKPFEPEKLIYLVSKTIQDQRERRSKKDPTDLLSPREYEAFRYFVQGFENAYVADHMKIKISTVKEFKMNIMKKLNVKTMSELISKYRD